jgi:predicted deacylase
MGGGGTTSRETQAIADQCLRRLLAHLGVIADAPQASKPTRMMHVTGPSHYVYAPVRGLFEPDFALGDTVGAGAHAGRIHFLEEPERAPREGLFRGRRHGRVPTRGKPGGTGRLPGPPGDRRLTLRGRRVRLPA